MSEKDILKEDMEDTAQSAAQQEDPAEKKAKKPPKAQGAAAAVATEEKLAAAEEKTEKLQDQLLRTAAEYDNYRRRSQKEQEQAFSHGVAHAAVQLLPVLDTLEAAANAETVDEEYKKGVLMTLAKCQEVFCKLGISEIEALGQPFDPNLHDACMQEGCDGATSGTITRVVQKGYTQGERVVRHAVVAVAP